MAKSKQFLSYEDQVELLRSRGMLIADSTSAETTLSVLNYYRLSGYWYPMRHFSGVNCAKDSFKSGASFELLIELYRFDERLRHAVFHELDPVELALRTMLGHKLGEIDPLVYLNADGLGPKAKEIQKGGRTIHENWLAKFNAALNKSKEDFVEHHRKKYDGVLPIWAAVELMDWGMLQHLYSISPNQVKRSIAQQCGLSDAQLLSWLRSLTIVRNYAAHHARMFNRVYSIRPKLNDDPRLQAIESSTNRAFGQLSLIQYLHRELGLSTAMVLPEVLNSYPHNDLVPFRRTGAPENWSELELWKPI